MYQDFIRNFLPYFRTRDGPKLIFICLVSVIVWYPLARPMFRGLGLASLLLLPIVFFLVVLVFSLVASLYHRLTAPDAGQLVRIDGRPPVLYLRSFEHDDRNDLALRARIATKDHSDEEILARLLCTVGPMVALDPKSPIFRRGAARAQLGETQWRTTFRELLPFTGLVVVRASDSPGLLWETRCILKNMPPERILLLIAVRNLREWDSFCASIADLLPHPLPSVKIGLKGKLQLRKMATLVYFSKDFVPWVISSNWNLLRLGIYRLPWGLDPDGLQSFFQQLDLPISAETCLHEAALAAHTLGWNPEMFSRHYRITYGCTPDAVRKAEAFVAILHGDHPMTHSE